MREGGRDKAGMQPVAAGRTHEAPHGNKKEEQGVERGGEGHACHAVPGTDLGTVALIGSPAGLKKWDTQNGQYCNVAQCCYTMYSDY